MCLGRVLVYLCVCVFSHCSNHPCVDEGLLANLVSLRTRLFTSNAVTQAAFNTCVHPHCNQLTPLLQLLFLSFNGNTWSYTGFVVSFGFVFAPITVFMFEHLRCLRFDFYLLAQKQDIVLIFCFFEAPGHGCNDRAITLEKLTAISLEHFSTGESEFKLAASNCTENYEAISSIEQQLQRQQQRRQSVLLTLSSLISLAFVPEV